MTDKEIREIVYSSYSKAECIRKLGFTNFGGHIYKKLDKIILDLKIDTSHFCSKSKIYEKIVKICPVCDLEFTTSKGSKKEKYTCSQKCGSSVEGVKRSKRNVKSYRAICFKYHEKKCCICDESNIVEVHHLNENKYDDNVYNLVPLCPTHHNYWHSRYKSLIENDVLKYVEKFKENNKDIVCDLVEENIFTDPPIIKKVHVKITATKEELELLIKNRTYTEIGKMFGVSDNAIKKRCKKLGIVLENRLGYWTKVKYGKL